MASPVRVQGGMPTITVSQSTMVALALFVLFLVYITAKGELQNYLAVLFGPVSTTASGTGSTGNAGSTATGAVSGALGMAQQATSTLQQAVGLTNQASNLLSGGGGPGNTGGGSTDYSGNIDVGGPGSAGAITGSLSSTGGLF